MNFSDRVKNLELPLDELIVFGSGLLAANGLREANDIDLVVTSELFEKLLKSGDYEHGKTEDGPWLRKDDVEIWLNWLPGNDFVFLMDDSVIVDGVRFVSPKFLIERKLERGTDKDLNDVQLLKGVYGE